MTKYLFFVAALFVLVRSSAQTASWQWMKNATMGDSSYARSVATDPSGNVFVDGSFLSSSITIGSTTLSNTGAENNFLAKYDNTGAPLWAIKSSGKFNNVAFPLTADGSGNVIISGYFLSDTFLIGTDTLYRSLPMEIENAFIAKVGPDGTSLWASRPYSNGYTQIQDVTTDKAGNIYAAGAFICLSGTNYVVLGADTLYNDTSNYMSSDIFLVKYAPDGHVLWAKSFGGSDRDIPYSIRVDNNNNILMTGTTMSRSISFGSHNITTPGSSFVVKFDSDGNTKWVTTILGGRFPGGLAADKQDNVFVSGYYTYDSMAIGAHTLYNDTPGNQMMFVAKTDSDGNVLWVNSVGYNNGIYGYVYGASLITDTLGDVLVTGRFYGYPSLVFGPETLYDDTAHNYTNFFIMEYDAAGFPAWATTATGMGNFGGNGITAGPSGDIYVIGSYSSGAINLGGYSLPVTHGGNTFLAKLSPPGIAGVPVLHQPQQNINVYPVPSASDVHVTLTGSGYTALVITDMSGRNVWTRQCVFSDTDSEITIPASAFIPGTYVVTTIRNGSGQSKTFVIR